MGREEGNIMFLELYLPITLNLLKTKIKKKNLTISDPRLRIEGSEASENGHSLFI